MRSEIPNPKVLLVYGVNYCVVFRKKPIWNDKNDKTKVRIYHYVSYPLFAIRQNDIQNTHALIGHKGLHKAVHVYCLCYYYYASKVVSTVCVCVLRCSPGVHAMCLNKYCLRVFKEHCFCSDARITVTKELIIIIDKQVRHNMENLQWTLKGLEPVDGLEGQRFGRLTVIVGRGRTKVGVESFNEFNTSLHVKITDLSAIIIKNTSPTHVIQTLK